MSALRRRTSRTALLLVATVLAGTGPAVARDGPSATEVHAAIDRGADFLRKRFQNGFLTETWHEPVELVVLTLAHAGVKPDDPVFQAGLTAIETCDLVGTYRTATLAMALGHINPWKYRNRLARAAQWLVDTQLEAGDWGYPGSVEKSRVPDLPPAEPPSEGEAPTRGDPPPIEILRRTDPATFGGAKGDFSNTQFAILGLRACMDAGIVVPPETWQAALDYIVATQREEGGWGYYTGGQQDDASYASLTAAGAVGAAICVHGLRKGSPKSHPAVKKALKWLDANWEASRNVGIDRSAVIGPSHWQAYHLYAIERVGRVLDRKKVGRSEWYPTGASWLLGHQNADGSWEDAGGGGGGPRPEYLKTADTCFAILFLAQATPPLTR